MENNTEIGKLLKRKLSNLDESPNDLVWKNIEASLKRKKRRRLAFMFFFSLFFIGVISTSFYVYYSTSSLTNSNRKNKNNDIIINNDASKTSSPLSKSNNSLNQKSITADATTNSKTTNSTKKKRNPKKFNTKSSTLKITNKTDNILSNFEQNNSLSNTYTASVETAIYNSEINKQNDSVNKLDKKEQPDKAINDTNLEETHADSIEQNIFKNLSISLYYGPSISGTFSKKSLINNEFNTLTKRSQISSTYGVSVKTTQAKQNFSVSFFVTNLDFEYQLEDESFPSLTHITLNNDVTNNLNTILNNSNNNTVTQNISFYNFSFNYYRTLLNKEKYNIEGIGGVSFQFLNNNSLYLSNNILNQYKIGSVSTLSKENFSIDAGFGFNYHLSKKIDFTVNPILNLYLIPLNTKETTSPFTFYVHTGINYKF